MGGRARTEPSMYGTLAPFSQVDANHLPARPGKRESVDVARVRGLPKGAANAPAREAVVGAVVGTAKAAEAAEAAEAVEAEAEAAESNMCAPARKKMDVNSGDGT